MIYEGPAPEPGSLLLFGSAVVGTLSIMRRKCFRNVKELVQKIDDFVQHYNRKQRPFIWTGYRRFRSPEDCPTLLTYFRDATPVAD